MTPSKKVGRPTTKQSTQPSGGFLSNIRWGESYVSLLLGAIVVVVAAALGLFYVKLHQPKEQILPPAQISRVTKLTVSPSASVSATAKPSVTSSPTPVLPTKSITPTEKATVSVKPTVTKKYPTQSNITAKQTSQKTYVVQKNDNLWNIAVKEYGSGYSWVSIAQANNLGNPGLIYSGNTLIIPSVTPILVQNNAQQQITPTSTVKPTQTKSKPISPVKKVQQKVTPTPSSNATPANPSSNPSTVSAGRTGSGQVNNAIIGSTYTVQKGDTLWNIAIRAYGNGYKWVDIANANHLANPSVIHSGNILNIPRPQTL